MSEIKYYEEFELDGDKYRLAYCSAQEQLDIADIFAKHTLDGVLKAIALGSETLAAIALFGELHKKRIKRRIKVHSYHVAF